MSVPPQNILLPSSSYLTWPGKLFINLLSFIWSYNDALSIIVSNQVDATEAVVGDKVYGLELFSFGQLVSWNSPAELDT